MRFWVTSSESQGCINWLTVTTPETPPLQCCFPWGEAESVSPHLRHCCLGRGPTCTPSSIHPTVWPQYTNVINRVNRQTGHRYRSIGRTVRPACNGHPESMRLLGLRGGVYYGTSNKNICLPQYYCHSIQWPTSATVHRPTSSYQQKLVRLQNY